MAKRSVKVIVLVLLMLVGCSFAVWEILIFVQNAQTQSPVKTSSSGGEHKNFRTNDTDMINPIEFLQESEKTGGLFRKTLSNPTVTPPKGAKRIRAVGRKTIRDGYVELQWSYEISGGQEAVIAHYSKALKKNGFVLRSEKRKAPRVGMVFHRYPVLVTLSLKQVAEKGNLLNVTVCENRPERSGDFLKTPDNKTEQ